MIDFEDNPTSLTTILRKDPHAFKGHKGTVAGHQDFFDLTGYADCPCGCKERPTVVVARLLTLEPEQTFGWYVKAHGHDKEGRTVLGYVQALAEGEHAWMNYVRRDFMTALNQLVGHKPVVPSAAAVASGLKKKREEEGW